MTDYIKMMRKIVGKQPIIYKFTCHGMALVFIKRLRDGEGNGRIYK